MKKILTLVCVSALGGLLAIGGYKLYIEKDKTDTIVTTADQSSFFVPTSSIYNTANSVSSAPNFVAAAEQTIDAVVHVKNTSIISAPMSLQDLFYGRSSERAQIGTGSGVIISPSGHIITNNHVIRGASEISITLNNNKTYTAELIGTDQDTDIALLKINAEEDLPFITFGDSDNAKIGEWVLAVGNPFNLNSTVTAGIISAKSRDLSGSAKQSFIQTDAAVNPGNSGGALVNTKGELIGINTAITSQTGSYIGYSFAVPSNIARKIVNDIMEYGNVQNGILGVKGGELNAKAAEQLNIDITEGFYVSEVEEDTGAAMAGIRSGDIIKKLDDIDIQTFADLKGYLNSKSPNDVINVTILRNGKNVVLPVTLIKNSTFVLETIGVVKNASDKDLKKYKVNHGIKIRTLDRTYYNYWKRNGVEEGSLITSINSKKVSTIEDAQRIMKNRNPNEILQIEVINNQGEKMIYNFR
ncbi:MAG: trypsin-like peptidase domain-containing protein [Bacteroidia bacterium]|nr:trypsin-like peptidase domain-containing protein [Bacteroidia bacterium]NNL83482.1 PDZ domain-containing protein [Winogradskyella sp.]